MNLTIDEESLLNLQNELTFDLEVESNVKGRILPCPLNLYYMNQYGSQTFLCLKITGIFIKYVNSKTPEILIYSGEDKKSNFLKIILGQWYSDFIVYQNHPEGLWKQCSRLYSRSFWFSRCRLGPENVSNKIPGNLDAAAWGPYFENHCLRSF